MKHVVLIKTGKCNQTTKNLENNENLAIWLNALNIGKCKDPRVKRPQGKKTQWCSRPGGKQKSTKNTYAGFTRNCLIRDLLR
jgi:hypothetical protein